MTDALILGDRIREVWTPDDRKRLDRCAEMMVSHGDRMLIRCDHPLCPEPVMHVQQDPTNPHGLILRCGCRDRVFPPKL